MRDYGVATTSRQPKRAVEELKQARVQTAVRPTGVSGDIFHLQRLYGNYHVQRVLDVAAEGRGPSHNT